MGVMSSYIPESTGRNKKRSIIAVWDVQDTEVVCHKGFETRGPSNQAAAETHTLDRAATGIGFFLFHFIQFVSSPFVSLLLRTQSSLYSSHTVFRLSSRISRSQYSDSKKFQK